MEEIERSNKTRLLMGRTLVRTAAGSGEIEYVQVPVKKGQWMGDDGLPDDLYKMISDAVESRKLKQKIIQSNQQNQSSQSSACLYSDLE